MVTRFLIKTRLEVLKEASNFILNSSVDPKTDMGLKILIGELSKYVMGEVKFDYEPFPCTSYPHFDKPSDAKED